MSRKDRYELDIWYSNWRAGWKLQTKDMKFSRSERGMEVAPIPSSTKRLKHSDMGLDNFERFFLPDNLQKGRQKNVQDYYPLQHHFFERRKNH